MGNHFGPRYKTSFVDNGPPNPQIKLDLVHSGLQTNVQAWQKVIPALSQHSRVVVPDLVGFGLSDK